MQSYLEKQELIPGDTMLKPFQALMILGMVLEQVTGGWKQHYSDSALGSSSVVLFTSDVKSKQNHLFLSHLFTLCHCPVAQSHCLEEGKKSVSQAAKSCISKSQMT